ENVCGKWMRNAKTNCGLRPRHLGTCRSPEAVAYSRSRDVNRRRSGVSPERASQWRRKSRLRAYGLSEDDFDRLLEAQGSRCAMCHRAFEEGQLICIDHEHAC